MGIFIDNHFYSDLFKEKKVNHYNELYLLLFDTIWPRSQNFERFLTSSDTSLKIEYAKKIYKDFSFVNDIFLPPFTILNVLDDQYKNFRISDTGYKPQDHVVHCIHLYILGVYLFFNSEKMNRKLIKHDNKNQYHQVKDFVIKWQVFSLYHDVGYFFEDENLFFKDISEYNEIFNHVLRSCLLKNISRTYAFKALTEKYPTFFDVSSVCSNFGAWYDKNGKKVSQSHLIENIDKFNNAVCLEAISNDEELSQLFPLIKNQEHLVSIYNNHGNCVMLMIRKNYHLVKVFSKSISLFDELLFGNIVNIMNNKYICKYYMLNLHTIPFWSNAIDDQLVINNVNSQFPSDVAIDISINAYNFNYVLFLINDWITNEIAYDNIQEQERYENNYENCLKESYVNNFIGIIKNNVNKIRLESNSIGEALDLHVKNIKSDKKSLINKIQKDANDLYNHNHAITHVFNEFFTEKYDDLSKQPFVEEDKHFLRIFELLDKEISASPFSYNKNNKFHSKLYTDISCLAKKLGTTVEELILYHSPYVSLDHGVISAALLFQFVCFSNDLKKYCLDNSQLALAWNFYYEDEKDNLKICSETIFSVLLHNIYNKKSTPEFGLDYIHNFDVNPFSYFCTFCDTIQKWGRTKKINLSHTNLTANSFLEDEFDIEISEGRIIISCLKKNINSITETIFTSESFLPGISKLVEVKEF